MSKLSLSVMGAYTTGISDTYIELLSFDAYYSVTPSWELTAALYLIDVSLDSDPPLRYFNPVTTASGPDRSSIITITLSLK
ncbi:MAG: hypothetical protein OSB67_05220 [Alphaproteobacteria bacterium]|nr:hypothetical protein [Alphaproteobacteria bacterium]